jgi:hypothetical protein
MRISPGAVLSLVVSCLLTGRGGAQPALVLNEFMAGNQHAVRDDAGDADDWIEIYNYGSVPVDVGGFYLTDDLGNATKWRFPTNQPSLTTIPGRGFLIVWADQETGEGPLHANFQLSAAGEEIGLYSAPKVLVDSVTFGVQEADRSYGRLPDGTGPWQVLSHPSPGKPNNTVPAEVVINEILYHPYHQLNESEDTRLEFIELHNPGTRAVPLAGWRLSRGVDFTFPGTTLNAGAYLVVAADVAAFQAAHAGVTNVIGGWIGQLSDSGETVELSDDAGLVIDRVPYADEGDWSVRVLGPDDRGHRGWEWSDQTDGAGGSLELINADLPNEYGQNWTASLSVGGTPGQVNAAAANDLAPLIVDVEHTPIIPKPADRVTVKARIIGEQADGITAQLHYRVDQSAYEGANVYPQYRASDYTSVTMLDDGAHGDGAAGDGVYGGQLPARPHGTIVEFFVEAQDQHGNVRTWPAPSVMDNGPQQVTNLLYQVDQTFDATKWTPGSQPIYYLIMTEMERGRLAYIGAGHSALSGPDAQMNGTFISVEGAGMELRYTVAIRNRGHGTRNGPPNNFHVSFGHSQPWKGRFALNFNCRYTHSQIAGSAIFHMAGFVTAYAVPAQLRVNGVDLAYPGSPMFGVYARLDALDDYFTEQYFPDDPDGNLYKCFRTDNTNIEADLRDEGDNPDTYRNRYFKASNASAEDWSDLLHLIDVLNNAPEATYLEDVGKVINLPQWLRYIALDSLLMNYETGLNRGIGDDYFLYRGVADPRFVLIPHDLDTILNEGNDHGNINQSIFSIVKGVGSANGVDGLKRLFNHPEVARLYQQAMADLINEFFKPQVLDPLLDDVLGGFTPPDRIEAMKQFARQRSTAVLDQIPKSLMVRSDLPVVKGYASTMTPAAILSGTADVTKTRSVRVGGQPATWSQADGNWSGVAGPLNPGISRIVVQALDDAGGEVGRSGFDVWYDSGAETVQPGGTLGADEVWTAAAGPWHVTGSITIPAGRTLTIEPGTTVFLDDNCGFVVQGRLVAQGTEYQRIRFTRVPGTTTQWAGFQVPDSREDNIIAYADLEFGGSRSAWITIGNNDGTVVGPTARLTIEHATFSGSDTPYFSIWDPQVIIRHSTFADLGSHYMIAAQRMPADGWFIVEGNLLGHTHGNAGVLRLNSLSVKGGPAAQILDNVFTGAGGNLIACNETDSYVAGNLFMHAHAGDVAGGAAAALATGPDGGSAGADNLESQHLTVVRNVFYHNDYGILDKTGAYAELYNDVFIGNAGAILCDEPTRSDSGPGRAAYVENCIFWNNGPEADGTSAGNGTGTFVNRQETQLTVNNSIVAGEFLDLGAGNIDADPLLLDADREWYVDMNLPRFSTGFPGLVEGAHLLAGMVPDVRLRPESPARGTGFAGVDMGSCVPGTASLGGVPASPTPRTGATLTVGGTDVYGYKYRVTGPGFSEAWSAEMGRTLRVTALSHRGTTATAIIPFHGFVAGDVVEVFGADPPAYNGLFTLVAATPTTFSYTLPADVDLLHPDHLDVWVRDPEPIQLSGLTDGVYTVSTIKKNSLGVWQDENQPTTATWVVDTSFRHLVINEILAVNRSAVPREGVFPDLVELYYEGGSPLDLAGMSLTDDAADPTKFVFPGGSRIAPGEYLVVSADANAAISGQNLGFGLDGAGDGLYLYGAGGALVDSVEFGRQLADVSIGRVGPDGSWHLTFPTLGQANVAYPLGRADALRLNEWLAEGQVLFTSGFVELYNPQAGPVDMGGIYLAKNPALGPTGGAVTPLSFIPGGGFAAFWAGDAEGPGRLPFRLSGAGEMLGLFDGGQRQIDRALDGPQTPDFSRGRVPDGADTIELQPLPTPGVANPSLPRTITTTIPFVPEGANKRVRVPTQAISDDWTGGQPFDDSAWTLCAGGPGGVGYERDQGYESLITLDTRSEMYGSGKNNSCYVRIPFTGDARILADLDKLMLKVRYDDGFIAYLNGREVARREFTGTPSWDSHADTARESSVQGFDEYIDISEFADALKAGANILAVHAMNSGSTSSDFLILVALDGVSMRTEGSFALEGYLRLLDGLRITELMYHAPQGPACDYVELQNVIDEPLDVNGVRFGKGINFTFPALTLPPGETVLVVADLAAFRATYGAGPRVVGPYSGSLSNGGEGIVLQLPAPYDAAILRFTYSDAWYPDTDGGGKSLVIQDSADPPVTWNDPASWQPSDPTPGQP